MAGLDLPRGLHSHGRLNVIKGGNKQMKSKQTNLKNEHWISGLLKVNDDLKQSKQIVRAEKT
jgi:hypothetical protein